MDEWIDRLIWPTCSPCHTLKRIRYIITNEVPNLQALEIVYSLLNLLNERWKTLVIATLSELF